MKCRGMEYTGQTRCSKSGVGTLKPGSRMQPLACLDLAPEARGLSPALVRSVFLFVSHLCAASDLFFCGPVASGPEKVPHPYSTCSFLPLTLNGSQLPNWRGEGC